MWVNRAIALVVVGLAAGWVLAWFRQETGSATLAMLGASMASIFVLLPLRCQLDPCEQ